jgi:hypothetical protein
MVLSNVAVAFGNMALAADQKAQQFREIAAWRNQPALSAANQAQALQAKDDAALWRLRQELAVKEGVLLHDPADAE